MKLSGSYEYDFDFAKKLSLEFTAAYSDKSSHHGYEEIYSHLLAEREVNSFLGIGLFLNDNQHTDLFAWERIFSSAEIFGADIKKHLLFDRDRIRTFFIDQSSSEDLCNLRNSIGKNIDVVLDDASHVFDLTINTFEHMFEIVSDGGIYMIEDILFENYNMDSWEQRQSQLDDYFKQTGLVYETYATSKVHSCVDSVILAVFK